MGGTRLGGVLNMYIEIFHGLMSPEQRRRELVLPTGLISEVPLVSSSLLPAVLEGALRTVSGLPLALLFHPPLPQGSFRRRLHK